MLNRAETPIFEEGLEALLRTNVGSRLKATGDLEGAVLNSEITFIAVGTPFDGKSIDLTAVLEVSRQIGAALARKTGYHVVVVKSTVVPGTTEGKVIPQLEAASGKKAGVDFGVGMNPEFLSEGEAVHDFMFPDRIVIGGIDERSIATIDAVYASFPDTPRIKTNPSTAELIKYASNALLANLISFANEISNVGSALGGIDAIDVMRGLHLSHYFKDRNAAGLPRNHVVSVPRAAASAVAASQRTSRRLSRTDGQPARQCHCWRLSYASMKASRHELWHCCRSIGRTCSRCA